MYVAPVVLAVIATVPLIAQQTSQPWRMTLEERIALRTDPQLARERVRRAMGAQKSIAPAATPRARLAADQFDGKSHPELFLPHEVFRSLMTLSFLGPVRNGDRFLYEVIAVNKFHSEERLPGAEVLRWAEGGCR